MNRMPKGINYLYIIQAAITFSYAIIYSSLSLYLTRKVGINQDIAGEVIGLFIAFNYALHLLAGYIGGRWISNRLLMLISIFFQFIGLFILSLSNVSAIYLGLSMFLMGCGFNAICFNCILVSRFGHGAKDDELRETATFMSYCFMNAGFLGGFLFSGYFEIYSDYNSLFLIGNIFNFVSLLFIAVNWNNMIERDVPLFKLSSGSAKVKMMYAIAVISLCIPLMLIGFKYPVISNGLVVILGLCIFSSILLYAVKQKDKKVKRNILMFVFLSVASIVFWMIYFVGPMSVSLFIKNNTDTVVFGYDIQPQWFNNINAIIIILGSPLLAALFERLNTKGLHFSEASKFSAATLLIACSFFMLVQGINHAMVNGVVSSKWVVFHYIFQSIGELFIGPVGYAMVGRLATPSLRGVFMGAFMLSSGVAASLASYFASLIKQPPVISPLVSNHAYHDTFLKLGLCGVLTAIIVGVAAFFISKRSRGMEKYA